MVEPLFSSKIAEEVKYKSNTHVSSGFNKWTTCLRPKIDKEIDKRRKTRLFGFAGVRVALSAGKNGIKTNRQNIIIKG